MYGTWWKCNQLCRTQSCISQISHGWVNFGDQTLQSTAKVEFCISLIILFAVPIDLTYTELTVVYKYKLPSPISLFFNCRNIKKTNNNLWNTDHMKITWCIKLDLILLICSREYYREPSPSPQSRHCRDYDRDRGRGNYYDNHFRDDFRHESSHRKRHSRRYRRPRRRSDSYSTVSFYIEWGPASLTDLCIDYLCRCNLVCSFAEHDLLCMLLFNGQKGRI